MKTALAAGMNAAALDFKKSLLESFATNESANQLLLSNVDDRPGRPRPLRAKAAALRISPRISIMCD